MTKTKKIKKPYTVYALVYVPTVAPDTEEVDEPIGVSALYHKEEDAKWDQKFAHEKTVIVPQIVNTEPIWKVKYRMEIQGLEMKISQAEGLRDYYSRRDVKRWKTEILALQSALACNE